MNKKDAIKMAVYSSLLRACRRLSTQHSTTFICPFSIFYLDAKRSCELVSRSALDRTSLLPSIPLSLSLSRWVYRLQPDSPAIRCRVCTTAR